MLEYNILLTWSDPDNCYITAVPALPGCMSNGSTIKQAIQNTNTIINEWIEICKESNIQVPKSDGHELIIVSTPKKLFNSIFP